MNNSDPISQVQSQGFNRFIHELAQTFYTFLDTLKDVLYYTFSQFACKIFRQRILVILLFARKKKTKTVYILMLLQRKLSWIWRSNACCYVCSFVWSSGSLCYRWVRVWGGEWRGRDHRLLGPYGGPRQPLTPCAHHQCDTSLSCRQELPSARWVSTVATYSHKK